MTPRSTGSFTSGNYCKVAAVRYGDREAYYCSTTGRHLTFRQFNERVNGFANGLLSLGVKKGDVTAFLTLNRIEIVETYCALGKIGSVGLPLNYRLSIAEIADLVGFCNAENIIYDPSFNDIIKDLREKLPGVKRFVAMGDSISDFAISYEELVAKSAKGEPEVEVFDEDPQYLNLTSGTTGLPKAYMLSQYNNCDSGPIFAYAFDMSPRDVIMTVFPIFGRVGYAWSTATLFTGARNVILPFDLNKVMEMIQQEKVTISNWVPTMASFILAMPDLNKYDLSSLRALVFAAAPFPVALQEQVKKRICPNLYEYYGLQETGILTSMGPKEKEHKPESVGTLYFGADVRVVDDKGKDTPVGQVGEIIGRGIAVTASYFKNEEKTREAFKDGWFHTGDLGRFDEDGYLYLAGRKKDMLISGGQNVFAVEVEETYSKHPAVFQCAVIGLPDPTWGEMVSAVIVKFPGQEVTEEELIAFGRERIAHFKVPKKIFFVDSLPMTPTGKVTKYLLVERFSKE
jgi:fatty-acyl-CoA synthase